MPTSFSNRRNERPSSRFRAWKWRLYGATFLLIVLMALAPTLIAHTALRNWIAAEALAQLKGDIRVGRASLGWFSALKFEDVEVRDAAGRRLLTAPSVANPRSLLSLLLNQADLGEFRIDQPVLEIVCHEQNTNLEESLAYWLKQPAQPSPLEGMAVSLQLTRAKLIVHDEDTKQSWTLAPLDLHVTVPHDRRTPICIKAQSALAEAARSGRLDVDLSVQLVEVSSGPPAMKGEGTVSLDSIPLALAAPLLRRFDPGTRAEGRLSGNLQCRWGSNDGKQPQASVLGKLTGNDIALISSRIGQDTIRLKHFEAPCRVNIEGSVLRIQQAEVKCDFGTIALAGALDQTQAWSDVLRQPGIKANVDVDLARIAQQLPNTLHLQTDTQITSGRFNLQLQSSARPGGTVWDGTLETADVRATARGQQIVWRDPIAVVFAAHQDAGALPVLDKLHCDSGFLTIDASGSATQLNLDANCDLGRLSGELGRFVDLGALGLSGQGSAHLTASRDGDGGFSMRADTRFRQLAVAFPGRPALREESADLTLSVIGKTAAQQPVRIERANLGLQLGNDRLALALAQPIEDVSTPDRGKWQGDLQGDIARWQDRLRPWVSLPESARLNGTVSGQVAVQPAGAQINAQASLAIQNFTLGPIAAPTWREPRITLTGNCKLDRTANRLLIENTRVQAAALACTAAGQLDHLDDGQDLVLDGRLLCDLEKLQPQLRAYLGSSATMTGQSDQPFHLEGPLGLTSAKSLALSVGQPGSSQAGSLYTALKGDGRIVWKSMEAYGCQVGAAEVLARLAGGWIRVEPIDCAMNQGRLHLAPSIRLDPGPAELDFPKGLVVDRARITPAACTSALGYIVPMLADVSQAEGVLSVTLDGGRVPMAAPAQADISGAITFHSARVGPGPLLRELGILLQGTNLVSIRPNAVVPFRLVNGRVYHQNLELILPDVTIRTSGSVGLDGTLSLIAEMPVPPKWLGARAASSPLAKETIRLPIAGTLSHPRIDQPTLRSLTARFARDAAQDVLKQELDKNLQKLLRPKR